MAGADGSIRLVGDVDFASVLPRAEAASPVPRGVGPVTDVRALHDAQHAARALHSP